MAFGIGYRLAMGYWFSTGGQQMRRLWVRPKTDWIGWLNLSIWMVWAILLVAHLLTLDTTPGGLHYDEAFNALDALRIGNDGAWPVFLQGNFGREPLMAYVMAVSLRVFGNSMWAVRLPVALAWGAAFPALYWLLHELHPDDRKGRMIRWAIAAPLFMTSLWFSIPAHYAIRTSWFVLLELLFLAALWRVWNTGDVRFAVLAGILGGLCFYTYLANRVLPLLLGAMLVIGFVVRRARFLTRWRALAIVSLVAIVVALPLIVHFVRFPEDFGLRASQVSVVGTADQVSDNGWASALVENGKRVAGMFFSYGDDSPRSNIPGRPVLTWWIFPLLLIGLVASVWPRRGRKRLFLLLWFLVMLLPTWLTEYAPNFQRAIGAFPPLVLLLAEGGYVLWHQVWSGKISPAVRISEYARSWPVRAIVVAVLVFMVLVESATSLHAFQQWASMPDLFYAFDEGLMQVGQYIADLPQDELVYLTPVADHPVLSYSLMTAPNPPETRAFDGRRVLVSRPGEDATYVAVVHEDFRFEIMVPWLYPGQDLQSELTFYDREGRAYARVFGVPGTAQLRTPQFSADMWWEDNVYLMGYDLIGCCEYKPGDVIYAELWWKAGIEPPTTAWTVFTHLLASDGHLVAGDDGEPGRGSYPTTYWQPGDFIVDEYQLQIPTDTPQGEYALEIGLYDLRTMQRLPLADGSGDFVMLHPITIQSQ
jgi:4-amino-4-deoxy-L-arabinose transferase-like glycosyltransferase